MKNILKCLLILKCVGIKSDSGCEVCDLTEKLEKSSKDLEECQAKLNDQSYLGQVCQRVGNWMGGKNDKALKHFTEQFLTKLDLLVKPLDANKHEFIEKDVSIRLTVDDLQSLRRFVLNDEGKHEEISRVLHGMFSVSHSSIQSSVFGHMKSNNVFLGQALFIICCLVLPLYCGTPFWKVFLILAAYAILNTWTCEYQKACAKKQATLAKLSSVPKSCLVEKQGWLSAGKDFITGIFNGVEDPCEAYYKALMVDPAIEVGFVHAVMETLSVCLIIPARSIGEALGALYKNAMAPLPFVWKVAFHF